MNEEQKPRTQPPQEQHDQPGDQHAMHPQPESIRKDYRGSGKLDGRVALITGGDSGIGRAVALHFAREGAHVAIVYLDDNRDAADTLAAMIRLLGHTVDCVYDPQGVEQAVERFEPELVFLDLGIPGRSGYDVARALRQGTRGDGLRLVAVTGWGQPEDHRRTQEAGFDGHLVKPPDLDGSRRMCATVAAPRAAEL